MTLEQLPLIMVRALLITVAVECAVAWLLGVRTLRDQKVVVLANGGEFLGKFLFRMEAND